MGTVVKKPAEQRFMLESSAAFVLATFLRNVEAPDR
jgi:hypothetical protein